MSLYLALPDTRLDKARRWLDALADMRDDVEEQQMLFGSPEAYEQAYEDAFDDFTLLNTRN